MRANASAAGFTLTAIITWVLRDYSDDIFKHIRGLDNCLNLANSSGGGGIFDTGGCVGKGAVLRVSFGNFIFFGAPLHGRREFLQVPSMTSHRRQVYRQNLHESIQRRKACIAARLQLRLWSLVLTHADPDIATCRSRADAMPLD